MIQNPPISVVMSVYNGNNFLEEAILSILNQTLTNFEFIIIDDHSTDNSLEIIHSYKLIDDRIKILRNDTNLGLARSLNKGIKLAKGEVIVRMDADDISLKDRLKYQYDYIKKNKNCIILGTNYHIIDEFGNYIYTSNQALNNKEIKSKLPYQCPFMHPTIMFRKYINGVIVQYPDFPIAQDLFLYNKLSKNGEFCNLKDTLLNYRLTPDASTRRNSKAKKIIVEALEYYNKNKNISESYKRLINENLKHTKKEYKKYNYYLLLSKKYLWNNNKPNMSRRMLKEALKQKFTIEPLLLLILSYLPHKILIRIYKIVKGT